MQFDRPHHQRIAHVLNALNGATLLAHGCYFGGGTCIALHHGEYRESVDIDFLVSDAAGYRHLRQRLLGPTGIQAILRPGQALYQAREVRADQYGIRTLLQINGSTIKFEIVHEGRITLEAPTAADRICGVATLTPMDAATSKLLANSDRWRDDAVFSRDLIDLAMMVPPKPLLQGAIAKASVAYGDSVAADLHKAIDELKARPHRLEQCMAAMHMHTVPRAVVWKRIRALGG